eukprot:11312026-Alexandrium_andersonii.AAC.1
MPSRPCPPWLLHMKNTKSNAIVGNIGYVDNEVGKDGFENFAGIKFGKTEAQLDSYLFPDGHG